VQARIEPTITCCGPLPSCAPKINTSEKIKSNILILILKIKIEILQFIFSKSNFTKILTNHSTLIRKLLKNGLSGNYFTPLPHLPTIFLEKRLISDWNVSCLISSTPIPVSIHPSLGLGPIRRCSHSSSFSRLQHVSDIVWLWKQPIPR
jgi:hypothetical protein